MKFLALLFSMQLAIARLSSTGSDQAVEAVPKIADCFLDHRQLIMHVAVGQQLPQGHIILQFDAKKRDGSLAFREFVPLTITGVVWGVRETPLVESQALATVHNVECRLQLSTQGTAECPASMVVDNGMDLKVEKADIRGNIATIRLLAMPVSLGEILRVDAKDEIFMTADSGDARRVIISGTPPLFHDFHLPYASGRTNRYDFGEWPNRTGTICLK